MKAVRATFLLLLFLTSFGRCWAESYGLLASSSWACCESVNHDNFVFDCRGDDSNSESEHNRQPDPIPASDCSSCDLVESGFTSTGAHLDFTAPIFFAIVPDWDDFQLRIQRIISRAEEAHDFPVAWSENQVILTISGIVTTTAVSVRGPNLG